MKVEVDVVALSFCQARFWANGFFGDCLVDPEGLG